MATTSPRRWHIVTLVLGALVVISLYDREALVEGVTGSYQSVSNRWIAKACASNTGVSDEASLPNSNPLSSGPVVESKWTYPRDWDASFPIYDNFATLYHRYASSAKLLSPESDQSLPYPGYETTEDGKRNDPPVPCMGPRGKRLHESPEDTVSRHVGRPKYFPAAAIGSNELIGLEQDVCYDRMGRHEPYGLKHGSTLAAVNWDEVDWAALQEQCINDNKHRLDLNPRGEFPAPPPADKLPRSAIVFRSYQQQHYTDDFLRTMRSIITELPLYSGGQYQAFLLLEVKQTDEFKIWDSEEDYQRALQFMVPPEFRRMTVLWSMDHFAEQYPEIDQGMMAVHLSQWFSMQYFRKQHPEFDYYWNWEMDVRYTGHHHDLVTAVEAFTAKQPRKGLWERNERIYMPKVHGSYDDFITTVQARYEVADEGNDTSIWGPYFPPDGPDEQQQEWVSKLNVQPPVANPAEDNFEWGVGESADFLTFLPLFNPSVTGYINKESYDNYGDIWSVNLPRRATIVTLSRLSSRLLQLMDAENSTPPHRHMSSEQWPHSISLHYGLKAVYVPHGIYLEQDWPKEALDWIFNIGDQEPMLQDGFWGQYMRSTGEGSGGPDSPFSFGREHSWERSTWYCRNRLSDRLYRRWLGWDFDGIGGEQWEARYGRFCLPPMLFHPIKELTEPGDYVDGSVPMGVAQRVYKNGTFHDLRELDAFGY